MKDQTFIARLKDIAAIKTVYMWGMFGGLVTESRIQEKTKQYPAYYNAVKQKQLRALIGKTVYAFDCVGLIKGLLWGWKADPSHPHGGAVYQANGLPDIDANVMINRCQDVSTDFSKIVPGAAVWLQGHIGIYIGDGKVVEATPAWTDGVQITALANRGAIAGLPSRRWTKWGLLPWVEYEAAVPTTITYKGKKYPAHIDGGITKVKAQVLVDMLGPTADIEFRRFAEGLGHKVHYNATTKEVSMQ